MLEAIAKFYKEGGGGMYPITFCAIFALTIIIERVIYLFFTSKINAKKFINHIINLLHADRIEEAISLCNKSNAPLPKIVKIIILKRRENERTIQDAVDEIALSEIPQLTKRTHYLGMLANVATLLGLLGTIFGLIQSFTAVAGAAASQKAMLLARGISVAMNTTAFGLLVGIPCLFFHTFLQSNTDKIISDIDEYSVKLINLVLAKQR